MKMIYSDDMYMIIDNNNNILSIGIAIDVCLKKYCKKFNCSVSQALQEISISI